MATIFRASEVWRTPAPGETKTIHVTAGVTRVTAVQVTNTTGGEVWLRQGAIAPRTVEDADFVIPPRSTANYPLDSEQISVRWNAQVTDPLDLITFAFTDQVVAPAVYPGAEPISFPGPVSSPVQKLHYPSLPFAPTIPPLTTLSGKNIGSVFIYNMTSRDLDAFYIHNGAPVDFLTVPPYSWATVPVNLPTLELVLQGSTGAGFLSIAWSDIDYVGPFPSGAGMLRKPEPGTVDAAATTSRIDGVGTNNVLLLTLSSGYWNILNAQLNVSSLPGTVLFALTASITLTGPQTIPFTRVDGHVNSHFSSRPNTITWSGMNIGAPIPVRVTSTASIHINLTVYGGTGGQITQASGSVVAERIGPI